MHNFQENVIMLTGGEWRLAHSEVKTLLVDSPFHQYVVAIFFKTMSLSKTITRFGFCDIRINQSRAKCYQPKPKSQKPRPIIVL